ncbi:MAG TPA: glycerol-3-phosphate acyltransferase, partial [Gemmatimonadales bacterium]|nr:glycerol-3-phosphate acyltransferase [Gemmatimonadales bacterium]
GMLPTLIFAPAAGSQPWAPAALGAAAVLGHAFSPFVGFRGGKGVATAAGVLMVLAPASLAVSAGVWAALLAATGFMSLASVLAAAALPVAIALSGPENAYTLGVAILFAGFIAFTHRANLRRLVRGTEPRMRSHGAHS